MPSHFLDFDIARVVFLLLLIRREFDGLLLTWDGKPTGNLDIEFGYRLVSKIDPLVDTT